MRFKPQKYRSFLLRGTATLATTLLLFAGLGCHSSKSTGSNAEQPPTVVTTTTTALTTTTITTMSTTTTTTTTVTVTETTTPVATTTLTTVAETIPAVTEIETEPEIVAESETVESSLPITEQDWVLIANVVSHEAGCSWISEYERVCIVAAIMNRVNDPRFPNTVDAVLHQRGQFFDVPYLRVDYSGIGYAPIDDAIKAYFDSKYDCGNINSWCGNGRNNKFYYQ